ncbi:heme-degrading domain-containing protein [Paenibacillus puerhi]|uniref:heme-degrading domain-containing protein n=1 Tax=Paenibacillus puerhi TaxID=2692622 RepID=UPI0013591C08|nr:heme-degrading domain-containing protein [Paenibacillus puerhi]
MVEKDYDLLLDQLLQEEHELQFTQFTNKMAFDIGTRIVHKAEADGKSILVDIERNGQRLFHVAMEGKSLNNAQWVTRKNNVVRQFGHSSYYIANLLKSKKTTMMEWAFLDPNEYAAVGGAFPILVRQVGIIGTVTVSGLPQEEDHRLVTTVLKEFVS